MSYFLFDKSLLPLGCAAAPEPATTAFLKDRVDPTRGRFAPQREQAPSPHTLFILGWVLALTIL